MTSSTTQWRTSNAFLYRFCTCLCPSTGVHLQPFIVLGQTSLVLDRPCLGVSLADQTNSFMESVCLLMIDMDTIRLKHRWWSATPDPFPSRILNAQLIFYVHIFYVMNNLLAVGASRYSKEIACPPFFDGMIPNKAPWLTSLRHRPRVSRFICSSVSRIWMWSLLSLLSPNNIPHGIVFEVHAGSSILTNLRDYFIVCEKVNKLISRIGQLLIK